MWISSEYCQELDGVISGIFLKLDKENTAVNEFLSESTMLSEVAEQLCAMKDLMDGLNKSIRDVESMLILLEDVCDEIQQKKNKVEHEYQLDKYRQRKNMELEQTKGAQLI